MYQHRLDPQLQELLLGNRELTGPLLDDPPPRSASWRRSDAGPRLDVLGFDRVPSVSLAKSQFVLWEFRVEGGDEKNFPRHFKVP